MDLLQTGNSWQLQQAGTGTRARYRTNANENRGVPISTYGCTAPNRIT
jgi:hypothetical protein